MVNLMRKFILRKSTSEKNSMASSPCKSPPDTPCRIHQSNTRMQIKVNIVDLQHSFSISADKDALVGHVRNKILKVFSHRLFDAQNYGLFLPPSNGRIGKFLEEDRHISAYITDASFADIQFIYKQRIYPLDEPYSDNTEKNNILAEKFLRYVTKRDTKKVERILKAGFDPNYICQKSGESPLSVAVSRPKPSALIGILIEGGAHKDFRTRGGMTPLHKAAAMGKFEAVKTLLDFGQSPNTLDSHGLTPLYYNIIGDSGTKVCHSLLYNHAQLSVRNLEGMQEIHQAAVLGRVDQLSLLIMYGADINAKSSSGYEVENASRRSLPTRTAKSTTHPRTDNCCGGQTPLHFAAFAGQTAASLRLLAWGADQSLTNEEGRTAFEEARHYGNIHTAEAIRNFHLDCSHRKNAFLPTPTFNPKRNPMRTPLQILNPDFVIIVQNEISRATKSATMPSLLVSTPQSTTDNSNSSEPFLQVIQKKIANVPEKKSLSNPLVRMLSFESNFIKRKHSMVSGLKGTKNASDENQVAREGDNPIEHNEDRWKHETETIIRTSEADQICEQRYRKPSINQSSVFPRPISPRDRSAHHFAHSPIAIRSQSPSIERFSVCSNSDPITHDTQDATPGERVASSVYGEKSTGRVKTVLLHKACTPDAPTVPTFGLSFRTVRSIQVNGGPVLKNFVPSTSKPSLVIISKVKTGSQAFLAGLREGDYVLKVNMTDVTSSQHDDVVRLLGTLRSNRVMLEVMQPCVQKSCTMPCDARSNCQNSNVGLKTDVSKLNAAFLKSGVFRSASLVNKVSKCPSHLSSQPILHGRLGNGVFGFADVESTNSSTDEGIFSESGRSSSLISNSSPHREKVGSALCHNPPFTHLASDYRIRNLFPNFKSCENPLVHERKFDFCKPLSVLTNTDAEHENEEIDRVSMSSFMSLTSMRKQHPHRPLSCCNVASHAVDPDDLVKPRFLPRYSSRNRAHLTTCRETGEALKQRQREESRRRPQMSPVGAAQSSRRPLSWDGEQDMWRKMNAKAQNSKKMSGRELLLPPPEEFCS